jgi:predicted ATPase/class 3 adenylate cyclase
MGEAAYARSAGTVTFLFTDVEGSTRLWEQHPAAMREALARHDALIEAAVAQHQGVVVRPRGEGDSRFAVFARATDAVAAAAAIQQALHAEPWPPPIALRVRLALHTGEADLRDGDYYGSAVNRCARLRSIAHGGQTLLSLATYDLVCEALPRGVGLHALGEHRLSDLQRAEQVYQLVAPGLPSEFPPLRSLEAIPHNLPLQVTSFVGREREMGEIVALLGGTRLLTLTGPGGTGKTRLAVQMAAELLERYSHGAWLVELAPLADPALVPQAVAAVLRVRDNASRPVLTTLTEALRSQQLLVVLDNCEHLIHACAQLTDTLVRTCPRVHVLATSREALGIAGETAYRVPSLRLPTGPELHLDAVRQSEAARLFTERAAAVQPHFALTPANAQAVVQVCQRLDGIPLALELAAARVRALTVDQVAARLDHRFRLLTGGSRTALPRQQTLRATIDWSYELLSEPERMLFARLSAFVGGWSLEAAEAICADGGIEREDVLDLLIRLVEKSLVLTVGADSAHRYLLLETLRHYGREKLVAEGEAEVLNGRHALYYLAWAEHAGRELTGSGLAVRLGQLEAELGNVRAALRWSVEAGDAEWGLRVSGVLSYFWYLRGFRAEGRAWLEELVALPRAAARTAGRGAALSAAGDLALSHRDLAGARALLTEALAIAYALETSAHG